MVHITLHDITKLVLPLNLSEGDVYLNMNIPGEMLMDLPASYKDHQHLICLLTELSSAKTVYIVTDVLKVSGMTFAVSGDGGRVMFQNLNSHFPVRTAHNKFRLRTDGCVCEAVGTCKCCQSVLNYSTNSQMDSGIRMETKWRILTDQLTPYLNLLPRNPGRPGLSNQRQQRASVFIHRANYNFLTSDHLFVVKFLTFTFPSLSFFKINA